MNDLIKIYDEGNKKFWFGISEVDRYQDEEFDPWWNVRIVYKNSWINYDENGETMTEFELKTMANEIEKRIIRKENDIEDIIEFMELNYKMEFEKGFEHALFIINMGCDNIHIWLKKEDLIKIYEYICDKLKLKKGIVWNI